MIVFGKTKGDLRTAGIRPVPGSIRTVIELRRPGYAGVFAGYAEEGGGKLVYLFPRSPVIRQVPSTQGPFGIEVFRRRAWNTLGMLIREIAQKAGLDGETFMREIAERAPADWEAS